MEENMEVVMDQAVAEPETAEGEARDEASSEASKDRRTLPARPDARETTADHEITDLSEQNNEIEVQDAVQREPVAAGGEDATGDGDGNEVNEPILSQIDPQVYAGWQELAQAHPEVVGKPLPDDIMKACVESGLPPLRVYESMMLVKQGEQIAALQQEIATLRQNAEAAERAPVTAASLGGNEGNEADDWFRMGFDHLVHRS